VSARSQPGGQGLAGWCHWVFTASAVLASASAQATPWLLESSGQAGLETDSNALLLRQPTGISNKLTVSANLNASRQDDHASSRAELSLVSVRAQGPSASDRLDGGLALAQTLSLPRGSAGLNASLVQDFNDNVIGADVTVGRGQRRTSNLAANGNYAITERLSAAVSAAMGQVGYGQELTRAIDYRSDSAAASLSWRQSELGTLTAQLSHSRSQALSGDTSARTDSVNLGYTRVWTERITAGLNLGRFASQSIEPGFRIVCPQPLPLCQRGSVAFILEPVPLTTSERGTDYGVALNWLPSETSALRANLGRLRSNVSFTWQWSERDSLTLLASQQRIASGVGRELNGSNLSVDAAFGLTPTARGSLRFEHSQADSRSIQALPSARQSSLRLLLVNEITRDLSLEASLRHTVAENSGALGSARSSAAGLLLRYVFARPQSPV